MKILKLYFEILVFDKEFSTNPRSLEEILKILEGSMQCPRGRGIAGERRSPASALPRGHGMLPKGIFPTCDGDMAVNSRPKARISRVFFDKTANNTLNTKQPALNNLPLMSQGDY